jgi:hypothetical protein
VEAIVYNKVYKTKEWTEDQGRDFLAATNNGYSHATIANLAGEVGLDPQNLAALPAALVAKVGLTGARLALATSKAEEALTTVRASLKAAEEAKAVATGLDAVDRAAEVSRLTTQVRDAEEAVKTISSGAYKIGGDVSKVNVLGQLARSEKATNLVRNIYKTYEPLQQLHVDKALKVARAVVDPLGSIHLHNPFRKQVLDLTTDDAVKTVIGAYGDGNHAALVHALADATEGASTPLADKFSEALGTYSANLTRRVFARTQRDNALANRAIGALMKKGVNEVLADLGDTIPKSYEEYVLREANHFRIKQWDDIAQANLAERLSDNFGIKSADEWKQFISGRNADQLSMLHAATYGHATKRLLAAVEDAIKAGPIGDFGQKLNRLILINRTTLTKQGAGGIVEDLKKIDGVDAKIAFIEEKQALYPELRGFTLDRTNPQRTVERFAKELQRTLESFPSQVVDDELAQLPDDLRAIHTDKTYTLGFAPEDEFKWGLVRANAEGGRWAPLHDVWVDHVAPGLATGYRTPGRLVEQNVAGQPIIGAIGKKVGRSIDYIDAGIKTMNRRISGTVIAESARNHFVQTAAHRFGDVGVTDKVAKDIMDSLEEAVNMQDIVVRPSGFTTKHMWEVAQQAIPKTIRKSDFNERDLLNLVLESYQGDMRYVGLTQALSSRVKRVLSFEGNNASVIAEQVYPTLKYRLNVIFQAMEKTEPWVLNTIRGVTPAKSLHSLNEADKATSVLLERMGQRSLISNADHEMAEYAGRYLHGQNIEKLAQASNSQLGKVSKKLGVDWSALRDVKGVKQVNMLRTFRKGLGKELRAQWDLTQPGLFDDMYAEAVRKAGKGVGGLDEDEFAITTLAEQMLGNGVEVTSGLENRLGKIAGQFGKVDYRAAITPGEWMRPQTLGGLQRLDLDSMAELMAFPMKGGRVTRTEADIRSALASGDISMEDIAQGLRRYNADPDHIMRVKSALEFSHTGFWQQVEHDFNLTPEQSRFYQDLIGNAADLRDMTPVEYLSQVLVPTIGEGSIEPVLGHLGAIKDVLGPDGAVLNRVPDLGQLRVAADAAGNEDQFVGQLASIFSAHLDPSAKRALLVAFRPELEARLSDALDISMETVNRLWTPEMDSELAKHILGEINIPSENLGDLYDAGLLRSPQDWARVDPGTPFDIVRSDGVHVTTGTNQMIGDGLRNADPAIQKQVLRAAGVMRGEFPDVAFRHMNIVEEPDFANYLLAGDGEAADISAVVVSTSDGGSAMIMNKRYFGADHEAAWSGEAAHMADFPSNPLNGNAPRETVLGAPNAVTFGPGGTVKHEMGHVIDEHIKNRLAALEAKGLGKTKEARMLKRYTAFRESFLGSFAHHRLSEYSHASENEMMAELIALATGGGDPAAIDKATQAGVDAFKAGTGPQARIVAPKVAKINDIAGADEFANYMMQTYPGADIRLLNSAGREWEEATHAGDLYDIEQAMVEYKKQARAVLKDAKDRFPDADIPENGLRASLPSDLRKGPQDLETAVADVKRIMQDAGVYRPRPQNPDFVAGADGIAPVMKQNPDVIRATQMFGKWTNGVMAEGIKRGGNASQAATLEKIAGIPTHQAVPYNLTEHLLMDGAVRTMQSKWEDAFRLQYYARQRSMLERSINHPMFGIYPASYMWGKIMPEMIRFMAQTPFGVRTGAAAYSLLDVQRAVALQREFDPGFDKKIEDLGHSAAFFALGYMLPSWPWESNASFPGYAREFAQEGLDMQARVDKGGQVATPASGNGINVPQVGQKAIDTMNPINYLNRALLNPVKELNPLSPPAQKGTNANPYFLPDDSGPVPAADLGDPLTDALSNLRSLFGG